MHLSRRTMMSGTAASALSVLALSACSKATESTGGGSSGDSSNEAIAAGKNDINPKDRDELGEGGTLRLMNNAFPANFNTLTADGNEANTVAIMSMVMPVPVISTKDGKYTANPQVTKRIEATSENPLVVELELQPNMKWSDGTAIDYTSVENTLKVMNGENADFQIAGSTGYDQVEKVEKGANDQTAKVTFKTPYADWMGLFTLGGLTPASLVASADAFNTGWVDGPKVTAGPFKIEKIDASNKTVSLVPDDAWWGDKPLLKKVLVTTIEDPSAAATSFKNGQLDAFDSGSSSTYTVVKPMIGKGYTLRKAAGPNWAHLTLNGAQGRPFADQALRQAFFRGVDRENIFKSVNGSMPYPKDMPMLGNHVLMQNQDGYKDNSGDYAKYDVDAAKKLLTDAGYTMENDKAMKDGKAVEVAFVYNDGSKVNEIIAQALQESMAKIGVTVTVQKVPPTDMFSKYIIPGSYDIASFLWIGNPSLSSGDSIWVKDGEQNWMGVSSDEVDQLIKQVDVESDEDKRIDLINQYDAKLWELAGCLPLNQDFTFSIQDDDLANYGARGFQDLDWTKVGYVKGSDKLKG